MLYDYAFIVDGQAFGSMKCERLHLAEQRVVAKSVLQLICSSGEFFLISEDQILLAGCTTVFQFIEVLFF